ncbi:MAG: aldehyde dehydrogenase (NADP(+)) [Reichenbachiella sp.]
MSSTNQFKAINPSTMEAFGKEFTNASISEINEKVEKAVKAFDSYRKTDNESKATFIETAAEEIMNLGDRLLDTCHQETALPIPRLQGERGRTVNQLKLFASIVREGSWVDARIDTAMPDRQPIPRSDLRHMLLPLGPVGIFGASNFPLAFSVGGGDTASALAAGCPVVVKGHPAHPGTSEMVANAFLTAVEKCGMPEGTFALIQGNINEVGEQLVKHPEIKAIGFTGSFRGGKALFDLANARPAPIPVFAEMGSTNPVFFLPGALKEKADKMGNDLAKSITMGVGQFCTNPGLAFLEKSEESENFTTSLTNALSEIPAGDMLTEGIKNAYDAGIKNISMINDVSILANGKQGDLTHGALAKVFKSSIEAFNDNPILAKENFGPSNILVEAESKNQIIEAANNLEGHLTATVHCNDQDVYDYQELFSILEKKVGRVVINGYPTGVEVCHAMVHGGPYPSTTASQTTSVGTNAIKRFARPICFQDYPASILPDVLKDGNPLNTWRLINGELTKDKI